MPHWKLSTVVALLLAGSSWSCSSQETSCEARRTCERVPGAGEGGASGQSGAPTAGKAGASGAAGEPNGGMAGNAGSAPCEGSCGGSRPACDTETNACVACVAAEDCVGARRACEVSTHECVECVHAADCTDGSARLCDEGAHACVGCLAQSDCGEASASKCVSGACAPCTSNADCSDIAGKGVCDAGTCVACTGKDYGACGESAGTPLVCDSEKRTCTTSKQRSSGLCQPCVSDSQCALGQLCVLDKLGSPAKDVGYFCHWKQGDIANGAPANCSISGMPYVATQSLAVSIDGATGDICTLAVSTCVARNQFRSKDCAVANAPSDALCGFSAPKDAKCVLYDLAASAYRCTMTCLSDDDCPSPSTCNTGVSPAVCTLN